MTGGSRQAPNSFSRENIQTMMGRERKMNKKCIHMYKYIKKRKRENVERMIDDDRDGKKIQ